MKKNNGFIMVIVTVIVIIIGIVSVSTLKLAKGTYADMTEEEISAAVAFCYGKGKTYYSDRTIDGANSTTYSENGTSITCYDCPSNFEANSRGYCVITCAENTTLHEPGATECTSCPLGTHRNGDWVMEYGRNIWYVCFKDCYSFQCNDNNKWEKKGDETKEYREDEFGLKCVDGNDGMHHASATDISGSYCNHCAAGSYGSNNGCDDCYCSWCDNGSWTNQGLGKMTSGDCSYAGTSGRCNNYSVNAITTFGHSNTKVGSCDTNNNGSDTSDDPSTSSTASTASSSTEVQASTEFSASQNQGGNQNGNGGNNGGGSNNVTKNPPTGPFLIIVAWIVALGAIVYSFLFFKKNSSI